jgi:hypothetical protein
MNILVLFFLGYLLYRFIGGFLVPLFRTSRQMRQQFQNMNRPANGEGNASNPADPKKPESTKSNTPKVGEYIDFEEINN